MKPFEYGDEEIGSREIGFAVSSTIIGIGALSMPRDIANQTLFSDGWIILLLGGLICAVLGWFVTRVAILFPIFIKCRSNWSCIRYTNTC